MPKRPVIKHEGTRACYSPALDAVSMPEAKLFESSEHYYSTLFHELTHATGHVSRLNRREITDPIRFEQELRVTIQALGWRSGGRYLPLQDDIASVAYWYQTLSSTPFPQLPSKDELEVI